MTDIDNAIEGIRFDEGEGTLAVVSIQKLTNDDGDGAISRQLRHGSAPVPDDMDDPKTIERYLVAHALADAWRELDVDRERFADEVVHWAEQIYQNR